MNSNSTNPSGGDPTGDAHTGGQEPSARPNDTENIPGTASDRPGGQDSVATTPPGSGHGDGLCCGAPVHRIFVFAAIAILGALLDLVTKHWAFARLGNVRIEGATSPPIWIIEGLFGIDTNLNEGAVFGIGQGQVVLFAGLSVVAAVGILYWLFVVRAAKDLLLTVSLGSVTAGIFGNLYDRLGLHGHTWIAGLDHHRGGDRVDAVRDWLHFKIDAIGFDWPIFNLADCFLVCGAFLLVWHAFHHRD